MSGWGPVASGGGPAAAVVGPAVRRLVAAGGDSPASGAAVPLPVDPAEAVGEVVRGDPLLAAAALVAASLAATAVWWGLRWLRRTPGHRFRAALAARDRVAVLLHPNPDPDAMASGMAVVALAASVGTEAVVQYPGRIRHQENRAFQTVLGPEFERVEDVSELAARDVVLVDHNEPRGFAGAGGLTPYAVVDHHPGDGRGSAFTDIRPDHGACATVFAEYLRALGWRAEAEGGGPGGPALGRSLATALLYGILSDTAGFTRGVTDAEFDAAAYLYRATDEEALARISNPPVDGESLEVKARAVLERRKEGPFVVGDVGEVDNVDALPQAADELIQLEGVTAAVVFGSCDGTLHLSGRSRDDRVHMGKTLQAAVEEIPMAGAGGHARMGGGQLSEVHMAGIGPGGGVSRAAFADRLFAAMGGEV